MGVTRRTSPPSTTSASSSRVAASNAALLQRHRIAHVLSVTKVITNFMLFHPLRLSWNCLRDLGLAMTSSTFLFFPDLFGILSFSWTFHNVFLKLIYICEEEDGGGARSAVQGASPRRRGGRGPDCQPPSSRPRPSSVPLPFPPFALPVSSQCPLRLFLYVLLDRFIVFHFFCYH